jgi:hypothetical protein
MSHRITGCEHRGGDHLAHAQVAVVARELVVALLDELGHGLHGAARDEVLRRRVRDREAVQHARGVGLHALVPGVVKQADEDGRGTGR